MNVRSIYAATIFHIKSINPKSPKFHKFSTSIFLIINRRRQTQELANLLQSPSATDHPTAHYYKLIHGHIITSGFQSETFLANILINSYSKCDHLPYARKLFDEMPERNVSSWSSMISAYTQHGFNEEAWEVFHAFRRSFVAPINEYMLASVVRVSTQLECAIRGSQLHGFGVKTGLDRDAYVGTSIVDFYSKIGEVEDAKSSFDVCWGKDEISQ